LTKEFITQHADAVECKGKDRYDNTNSEEKRAIGAVRAARSGGHCLFEMPTGGDFSGVTKVVKL
jgi:hypothetical protein